MGVLWPLNCLSGQNETGAPSVKNLGPLHKFLSPSYGEG